MCAQLLGLRREEVPTLEAALERGLIPPTVEELTVQGNVENFVVPDFQRIETGNGHLFEGDGKHLSKRLRGAVMAKTSARPRPSLSRRGRRWSIGTSASAASAARSSAPKAPWWSTAPGWPDCWNDEKRPDGIRQAVFVR